MKVQLALDHTSLGPALEIAEQVQHFVDIIELGTPLIKTEGLYGVKSIRRHFPNHLVLADLKTMDAGEYEAIPFLIDGADIVTVLGAADDDTIRGTIKAAHAYGKKAQVDLINVSDKLARALQVYSFGADIVGIHTGIDQQAAGMTPFKDLEALRQLLKDNSIKAEISVAGGIKPETMPDILVSDPDIVVVGGAITGAEDPFAVAKHIRELVDLHGRLNDIKTVPVKTVPVKTVPIGVDQSPWSRW